MATLTRKQREIQQREDLFLAVAEKMLLERGYLGTSMDRIAEETEYSKGTIYQHFTCKEDLIAAVLVRSMSVRERLFARAATFSGRPRERMTAIGVADQVFSRAYPDHARIEQITKIESIWDKASVQRREQFMRRDNNCIAILVGILRDAVASGDLPAPQHTSVEGIGFGLWAMATGARILITHGLVGDILADDPERHLFANYQTLLDGYGWRPLSTEWDYPRVTQQIRTELFPENFQ